MNNSVPINKVVRRDCKLVYELYQQGLDNEIKGFSIEKEEFVEMKMEW